MHSTLHRATDNTETAGEIVLDVDGIYDPNNVVDSSSIMEVDSKINNDVYPMVIKQTMATTPYIRPTRITTSNQHQLHKTHHKTNESDTGNINKHTTGTERQQSSVYSNIMDQPETNSEVEVITSTKWEPGPIKSGYESTPKTVYSEPSWNPEVMKSGVAIEPGNSTSPTYEVESDHTTWTTNNLEEKQNITVRVPEQTNSITGTQRIKELEGIPRRNNNQGEQQKESNNETEQWSDGKQNTHSRSDDQKTDHSANSKIDIKQWAEHEPATKHWSHSEPENNRWPHNGAETTAWPYDKHKTENEELTKQRADNEPESKQWSDSISKLNEGREREPESSKGRKHPTKVESEQWTMVSESEVEIHNQLNGKPESEELEESELETKQLPEVHPATEVWSDIEQPSESETRWLPTNTPLRESWAERKARTDVTSTYPNEHSMGEKYEFETDSVTQTDENGQHINSTANINSFILNDRDSLQSYQRSDLGKETEVPRSRNQTLKDVFRMFDRKFKSQRNESDNSMYLSLINR